MMLFFYSLVITGTPDTGMYKADGKNDDQARSDGVKNGGINNGALAARHTENEGIMVKDVGYENGDGSIREEGV